MKEGTPLHHITWNPVITAPSPVGKAQTMSFLGIKGTTIHERSKVHVSMTEATNKLPR